MPRTGSDRSSVGGLRLTALAVFSALVATLLAASPAAAEPERSDAVRVWNLHAVNALISATSAEISGAGQTPPVSQLHLAMVQGAVYDAVNAIDGGYQPYLSGLPAASPAASKDAAVATAAHHVLVGLVLADDLPLPDAVRARLDALYAQQLAGIPDGAAKTAGIAAGAAAAAAMLAARANDGRYGAFRFEPGDEPGEWRPTSPPTPPVNDPFAWIAKVDPFVLDSPSQFRTRGPHALTSRAYAKEYNEVKALGAALGSSRSPDQQALAQFYTVHPVELFNRTFRDISAAAQLSVVEEARLFAMLNLAGADSLINCWDDKAHWSFWRPITAIHEGDNDGNRRTVGNPSWNSVIPAPPYPDHPSGYNCVTGAMMYTARHFFGTNKMDFNIVKIVPGTPDVVRPYHRFTDVVTDTIDARVYLGIHFRAADVQGAGIGKDVARWLDKHFFQPMK
jgi:hypothetical protein